MRKTNKRGSKDEEGEGRHKHKKSVLILFSFDFFRFVLRVAFGLASEWSPSPCRIRNSTGAVAQWLSLAAPEAFRSSRLAPLAPRISRRGGRTPATRLRRMAPALCAT